MTLPSIVSGVSAFELAASRLAQSAGELRSGTGYPGVSAIIGAEAMLVGRDALRDTLSALGRPTSNGFLAQLGGDAWRIGAVIGKMGSGNAADLARNLDSIRDDVLTGIDLLRDLAEPTPKYA